MVEKQLTRPLRGTAWKTDNELNQFLNFKIVFENQNISIICLILLSTLYKVLFKNEHTLKAEKKEKVIEI